MKLIFRTNLAQSLLLMMAAATSTVAPVTAGAAEHRPPHPPLGIEKALMDAELAQQLAQHTGLAAEDLAQRIAEQAPHRVALELGLDRSQMQELHCAAVQALVERHRLQGIECPAPSKRKMRGEQRPVATR